jgi:hypothetical protein
VDGRHGYSDEAGSQRYSGQQGYEDGDWDRRGEGSWRDDDVLVPERRYGGAGEQSGPAQRYANPDWQAQSRMGDSASPLESPTNPLAAVSPGPLGPDVVSPGPLGPGAVSPGPLGPGAPGMGAPGMGAPGMGAPGMGAPGMGAPGMGAPPVAGPPPAVPGPASAPPREGVYRTRRPALAMLYLIGVALCEWPAIRLFADGALGDHVSSSTAVSGMFLIIGLPLFGRGLFAVQAGAGRIPDQRAGHGWLQPPVAYLTVGLVLLLAAGLAAS